MYRLYDFRLEVLLGYSGVDMKYRFFQEFKLVILANSNYLCQIIISENISLNKMQSFDYFEQNGLGTKTHHSKCLTTQERFNLEEILIT